MSNIINPTNMTVVLIIIMFLVWIGQALKDGADL